MLYNFNAAAEPQYQILCESLPNSCISMHAMRSLCSIACPCSAPEHECSTVQAGPVPSESLVDDGDVPFFFMSSANSILNMHDSQFRLYPQNDISTTNTDVCRFEISRESVPCRIVHLRRPVFYGRFQTMTASVRRSDKGLSRAACGVEVVGLCARGTRVRCSIKQTTMCAVRYGSHV